ncbi:hypothetical protein KCU73_g8519, partial [Aureobasidium melanogenum]
MNNRVPHHTTEQQVRQEHDAEGSTLQTNTHNITEYYNIKTEGSPKAKPRHLPPPSLAVEKEVIIICKTHDGKVNREYRFKRDIICRHSARIFDLCLRRTGSTSAIIYVYVEHQHNIFAHYEGWVRKSELPALDVTIADQRDVLELWIKLVVDYIKKAPDGDELRQLLLDLHVACFEINLFKRYFWMLGPRLCFAITRRKMLAHPPTMEGMGKVCAYHQHDQLFSRGECGAKVA